MAYTADTLSYEVLSDLAHRELKGPVWIMGVKYHLPRGIACSSKMEVTFVLMLQFYCHVAVEKEAMMDDIRSRIWCSYRKNFRPISESKLRFLPAESCYPLMWVSLSITFN